MRIGAEETVEITEAFSVAVSLEVLRHVHQQESVLEWVTWTENAAEGGRHHSVKAGFECCQMFSQCMFSFCKRRRMFLRTPVLQVLPPRVQTF